MTATKEIKCISEIKNIDKIKNIGIGASVYKKSLSATVKYCLCGYNDNETIKGHVSSKEDHMAFLVRLGVHFSREGNTAFLARSAILLFFLSLRPAAFASWEHFLVCDI